MALVHSMKRQAPKEATGEDGQVGSEVETQVEKKSKPGEEEEDPSQLQLPSKEEVSGCQTYLRRALVKYGVSQWCSFITQVVGAIKEIDSRMEALEEEIQEARDAVIGAALGTLNMDWLASSFALRKVPKWSRYYYLARRIQVRQIKVMDGFD